MGVPLLERERLMTVSALMDQRHRHGANTRIARSVGIDTMFSAAVAGLAFAAGAKYFQMDANMMAALAATHELTRDFPGQAIWAVTIGVGASLGLLRAPTKVMLAYLSVMGAGMAVVGYESAQMAAQLVP